MSEYLGGSFGDPLPEPTDEDIAQVLAEAEALAELRLVDFDADLPTEPVVWADPEKVEAIEEAVLDEQAAFAETPSIVDGLRWLGRKAWGWLQTPEGKVGGAAILFTFVGMSTAHVFVPDHSKQTKHK